MNYHPNIIKKQKNPYSCFKKKQGHGLNVAFPGITFLKNSARNQYTRHF